ncbi:hypothetical protein EMCRGX_G010244 [Ephydatia muelleri]
MRKVYFLVMCQSSGWRRMTSTSVATVFSWSPTLGFQHIPKSVHCTLALEMTAFNVRFMLNIHLKKSKCDQFSNRADTLLGHTAGCGLCPVSAILTLIGSTSVYFFTDQNKPITKLHL